MKKILIADDSSFSRFTISKMVQNKYGFTTIEASNGNIAVELYKQEKPDLVTMDIMMPECDGIEALKQILAFDPSAQVIMCTEIGQSTKVIESTKMGAKGFIIKPISSECFYSNIDNIINPEIDESKESLSEKDILDIHSIENDIVPNAKDSYSIRLSNDSLTGAGFLKDDLMLIDKSLTPEINDLVVASYEGEFVFGYYDSKELHTIQLRFANNNYTPIKIGEKVICGVVVGSVRKLK